MTMQPLTYCGQHDTLPIGVVRNERRMMNEQELVAFLHAHGWSLNRRKRRGKGKIYLYAQYWDGTKRTERYLAPKSRLDGLTEEFIMSKLQRTGNVAAATECDAFRLKTVTHPVA